jgi:hypothetical protein
MTQQQQTLNLPPDKLKALAELKSRGVDITPMIKKLLGIKEPVSNVSANGIALTSYQRFQRQYRNDRVAFVHDCIQFKPGQAPTFYQDEILAAIETYKRICVRGPHGLGKTALIAWMVIHFALVYDGEDEWKLPTTASAWRQLTKFLWPEIKKWTMKLDWSKIGREPFTRNELLQIGIKLSTGEAFAVASDNPAMIEGAHADKLLYVFDESKAIIDDTFDAAEGAFSNAGSDTSNLAFAIAMSTPGEPQGRFYDIQKRKPGYEDWWVRAVTLDECLKAGRISQHWVDQRRKQWGESSAVYQNRVLGEFAASDEDGVIPLSWVEAAIERWKDWKDAGKPGELTRLGIDVSDSGEDKTVISRVFTGYKVEELEYHSKEETMVTVGRVAGILNKPGQGRITTTIDSIGIGAGVVSRLKEMGKQVTPFNAAEGTNSRDISGELSFLNKRAAGWWNVRELLDPMNETGIALPPDDALIGDLTAPHWSVVSTGKIKIESKDDIRKRIGRSTDSGDAVMMGLWKDDFTAIMEMYHRVATEKKQKEAEDKANGRFF